MPFATPAAGVGGAFPLLSGEAQVIGTNSRRFLIATAMLVLAAGPARAEPAAPSPVPAPYPNTSSQDAAHKHIGNPKYSDFAKSAGTTEAAMDTASLDVQVQQVAWGDLKDAGTVYS